MASRRSKRIDRILARRRERLWREPVYGTIRVTATVDADGVCGVHTDAEHANEATLRLGSRIAKAVATAAEKVVNRSKRAARVKKK